jgi:hypothetical protein
MSTTWSPFSSRLITSNFSSILITFHWLFTGIALGDVDLCFSLTLVSKAYVIEEETRRAMWLYPKRNQSICVTDGVTVTSLSASLQHTTERVCHIVLNRKLSQTVYAKLYQHEHYCKNSKSGINFQVVLKWNHAKTNCVKIDLSVL